MELLARGLCDPHVAPAALDEMVKRQGWTSVAAQVAREPKQFGELRGREGFFAGANARAERGAAQCAADAVGPSLERIGAVEVQAERGYCTGVKAQRAADATGIPRLPATAEAAISTVAGDGREGAGGSMAGRKGGRARRRGATCFRRRRRAAVREGGRARRAADRRTPGRGHGAFHSAHAAAGAASGGRADRRPESRRAGRCQSQPTRGGKRAARTASRITDVGPG